MNVGAAQFLGGNDFTGCRLHERRTAQENRALIAHDHRLIGHGRHIGTARRATSHHHRDLRNSRRRQVGLVEKDAAEVIAIRKHFVLRGQKRAAAIDEIEAGQAILGGDFLRAQVLLHGQRIVRPALHRRVVRNDRALLPRHPADTGDDAGGRHRVFINAIRRELR